MVVPSYIYPTCLYLKPLRQLATIYIFVLKKKIGFFRYGEELYQTWQVSGDTGIQINGGGLTYLDYDNLVARTMDTGYYLTCMIPCEKLWPWLGSQLSQNPNVNISTIMHVNKDNREKDALKLKTIEDCLLICLGRFLCWL